MKILLYAITTVTVGWLIFGAYIIYMTLDEPSPTNIDKEYAVELVNQNTVKVYSYSSHKLYTVPMDSIISVFEIDNL